jgi:flagellar biosynthesis protein FlhG
MRDSGMFDQAARLREMIRRSGPVWPGAMRTVVIASGKGGVGKSTIALNLAGWLGYDGCSVLLVDADANLGNLDVMLGLTPVRRVGEVLRHECELDDVLVPAMKNVTLVPGSSGDPLYPASHAVEQRDVLRVLEATKGRFDIVLIDTSAGLSAENISYARAAEETMVVSNARPTAIMDSYAVIKQFVGEGVRGLSILMNGVHDIPEADGAAEKLRRAVRHFLKADLEYLGAIPFDPHAVDAETRQDALMRIHPSSRASRSMRKLASRFLADRAHRPVTYEGVSI